MKTKSLLTLGGAAAAGALGYWFGVRPWHLKWGTAPGEVKKTSTPRRHP